MSVRNQIWTAVWLFCFIGCAPDLTFDVPPETSDAPSEDVLDVSTASDSSTQDSEVYPEDVGPLPADTDTYLGDSTGNVDVVLVEDVEVSVDISDVMVLDDTSTDTPAGIDVVTPLDSTGEIDVEDSVSIDVPVTPCPPCDASCGEPCEGYPIRFNEVSSKGKKEIEIYNTSSLDWYLLGFSLGHGSSLDEDEEVFYFEEEHVLVPGEYFVIKKDNGHGLNLHPSDTLNLRSPLGEVLGVVTWGNKKAEHSYCRIPDISGDFQECSEKTFGAPNQSP
jgi:hypothetical protein